jgi:hypothetical protein
VRAHGAVWVVVLQAIACGSDPLKPQDPGSGGCETTAAGCPQTTTIPVEVSADQPTFVKLGVPAVVSVGDAKTSRDWDLSFQGYEVSTNGGISGPGVGAAFGPLAASYFAFPDEPVDVPFLIEDRAEGAFLRWYAYDGETHTIYSRHHVYGLRSNDVFYKLEVLSYYGEVAGAPVSALYRVRYAEVGEDENGETRDVSGIDGTVDGGSTAPDAPSGCLTLATGERRLLRPAEASESTDWDVCFRRDAISVNGELGGPGEVTAVDLAPNTNEPVADVKGFTAENTEEAFDAVDHAVLSDPALEYRGDYRTSAFTNKWVDRSSDPPVPVMSSAWLVVGADGISRYLVGFQSFDGATAEAPGRLELYVHASP